MPLSEEQQAEVDAEVQRIAGKIRDEARTQGARDKETEVSTYLAEQAETQRLAGLEGEEKLKGTLPKEGSTGWYDAWMLSSTAAHPNCAYLWMDYVSSPEVNGQIATTFGMAPANGAWCESSAEAKAHCEQYNATNEEYFDRIWPWTTPIEQCVDGRTDVRCTSFQDWTDAWATIKG